MKAKRHLQVVPAELPPSKPLTREEKLAAAKKFLGKKWILHPQSVFKPKWRSKP